MVQSILSILRGKSRQEKFEAAGITFTVRIEEGMPVAAAGSFYSPASPAQGVVLFTIKMGLPT